MVVKFSDEHEQLKPIDGQPSDTYLTQIQEVLEPLILQIPNDRTAVTHNFISLICPVAAYTA